jgi:hypothetical protein
VKRIIGFDIRSTNSEEARLTWEIRGYAAEIKKKGIFPVVRAEQGGKVQIWGLKDKGGDLGNPIT